MQNTVSQLLAPVKKKTASGVVKIVTVSHWGFAANDPNVYQGCSDCSYDVASDRLFMSEDPVGYKDGYNLYAYAHNNPLKYYDPMGTTSMTHAETIRQQVQMSSGSNALSRAMGGSVLGSSNYNRSRTSRSGLQTLGDAAFGVGLVGGSFWALAAYSAAYAGGAVAVSVAFPIIVGVAGVVAIGAHSYDAYRRRYR